MRETNLAKVLLACAFVLMLLAVVGWTQVQDLSGFRPFAPLRAGSDRAAAAPRAEPAARYGHTMVTISNTVYLFGGEAQTASCTHTLPSRPSDGLLNDLWLYETESNEWQQIEEPNPPPARKNHGAAVFNGKMYIFYGEGASGKLFDIWEYNPAAKTWTQMPSNGAYTPTKCSHPTVVTIGDRIYLFGGKTAAGYPTNANAYAYNPQDGYWDKNAQHPEGARYGHGGANVNNKLVVYGGTDGNTRLDDVWQYDPTANQWTQVPFILAGLTGAQTRSAAAMPAGRAFHAAVAEGNKMWVLGGMNQSGTDLSEVIEFDFGSGTWTTRVPLPGARSDHAAALLPSSRILVFGGQRNGQAVAETFVYSPSAWYALYLPLILR
jgi:N-acetylneuraminic acid mutarotase